ncbi:MAG: transposase [Candidatus Marinimicrobia bacterium]|nr:transposase [Candidatus Neomarinimicrobiota bacterium]MBL7047443.1 transposase [Candidatus Neomarinimicrobiota bacterium]
MWYFPASNLSRITTFTEAYTSAPYWIGVDVHKRSYHVALHRSDGEHLTWVTSAEPQTFAKQLLSLPVKIRGVAYESGPTGFGLARVLKQAGIPVIIAAPSRIPRAVRPGAKSDRLDCIKLAEYASRGMLKSIAIPSDDDEALRALLRRRHQLTKSLRRAKQRIKSFLVVIWYP